ncbi:Protein of unknown function (DUF2968) [Paraburkholderia sp. BL18I3N2]|uniref:DUF2968 domain-containing protein n=1 Tax=Paraburkholderia sp. BL18I3N2 TaxID=1938799 RepID=UPI000D42C67D|nr:Protein of unknown function (DUF2968) [Paraburkholderia sp. BL18I3N2]
MKYPLLIRRAMLLAASCALLQQGGLVLAAEGDEAAPLVGTRPAINTLTLQPVADPLSNAASVTSATSPTAGDAQGNVAELMQMIHDAKLSELRTTYNGSYGASLFFHPREMTYYIALFQDKHFWRVIKSEDMARAEAIYAGFAQQTAQLADVEIRRTQLQAQKAYIEDVIAMSEDRAKRLQADLTWLAHKRPRSTTISVKPKAKRSRCMLRRKERKRSCARCRAK